MPFPGIVTLLMLTAIFSLLSFIIVVSDRSPLAILALIFCASTCVGLSYWVYKVDKPTETQILSLVKVKDMVVVIVDDNQPVNMTSYFGREIDPEKYLVKMVKNKKGWNGGIYWTDENVDHYVLVPKKE